jgi:hypothetical protein
MQRLRDIAACELHLRIAFILLGALTGGPKDG